MKLYYMQGACSLATHIVLEWVGAPYETEKKTHPELKSEEYLRINPQGAVPALALDDGTVITQNAATLGYLADRYPDANLAGGDTPEGRAKVHHWVGFINSDMHPAFKPLFGTTAYLGDDAAIEKSKEHARKTVRSLFEIVNKALAGKDWIAGTRSIADPYLYVTIGWANLLKIDLSDLPEIARFQQKMESDPAVSKVLKAESA